MAKYSTSQAGSEAAGPQEDTENTPRPLNDEDTFVDRKCQNVRAENDRVASTRRNDADLTTDKLARSEMFEYIKSDRNTLDTHKDSQIANFYKNRSIFITGASGFVGKCLLEKLLRSCPDIETVYILMRPKRGKDIRERVEAIIRSELFDRLRNSVRGKEQLQKIVAVRGDITKQLFGLTREYIELLSSKVSLVIHSAATVKFVEPLRVAVENNVVSVENLINLASKLRNLEALVHVSTAYSNCDRKQVDEVFYEPPIEADKLIDMAQWMQPEMLDEISPVLLGKRPNTYTYTKAVAESLLVERSKRLLPNIPIAMVRPSIVAGIWRQPLCGWVDNFNGPTGVILSMMTGAIQAMLAYPDYCADIVPVDIVANLIICATWQVHHEHRLKTTNKSTSPEWTSQSATSERQMDPQQQQVAETRNSTRTHNTNHINVYNCVSGPLNPVAWRDFAKYIKQIGWVYPCNNLMGRPATLLLSNEFLFSIYNFCNHAAIAYAGDFLLKLAGQKPKLVVIYQRMMKMITTLKPFTTHQWLFECSNVTSLYDKLSTVDKEIFNFDIRQVRWDDYLRRYYVGSKIFALKDDPNQVVRARQNLRRMHTGIRLTQILFLALMYYYFLLGTPLEQTTIELLQHYCSQLFSIFAPETTAKTMTTVTESGGQMVEL